jgi:amino acid adenylation domain-containing protein/non-ribosomal peptide synthase protein (TIGR01720 family)
MSDRKYPLTHAQRRIWYIENIYPGTSLYNIGGTVRIKGKVDFDLLEKAINIFIKKNEILRAKIASDNGYPFQVLERFHYKKIELFDFQKFHDPVYELNNWISQKSQKPFNLEKGPLYYFAFFKINLDDNGYFLNFHHIIADGWSTKIFTDKISYFYSELLVGRLVNEEIEHSYLTEINNEKEYLISKRFQKNKTFWNDIYSNFDEINVVSINKDMGGKRKVFQIELETQDKIQAIIQKYKCSINTLFTAAFYLYLHKTTRQENIIIGLPMLNRLNKKQLSIFGVFTNTMPILMNIDNYYSLSQFLESVSKELKKYFLNQKYPYDLLVNDLELRKSGNENLFDICVNYYNTRHNVKLDGYPVENTEFYNGNQFFALQMVIKEWSDSRILELDFDYKTRNYLDEQIDWIYFSLKNIINQFEKYPDKKISELCLLDELTRNKIVYEQNNTNKEYPSEKAVHQLFEEQVLKTPENIAVFFRDIKFSYEELNKRSNQLANRLIKLGVSKNNVVGILVHHSIDAVIGMLGVSKSGAAYQLIDPQNPPERIIYQIRNSGISILLTNFDISENIAQSCDIINITDQDLSNEDNQNPEIQIMPDDLAYILYTSGSTGNPKGVMIPHKGLTNYIWWASKTYLSNNLEIFPLYSSLAFDLTVTSIFTPLISGNTIVVYQDDGVGFLLEKVIYDKKATIIKLTPTHLRLLMDLNLNISSIKKLIVGGEDLKTDLARAVYEKFSKIIIYNEYGPTEATVGCMIYQYDPKRDINISVPIGSPIDNTQIYILDQDKQPVPSGIPGEIYVSGDCVAKGYMNNPQLTDIHFLGNPFLPGEKMYKTGDLAKFLPDGRIVYMGRSDNQIKIRGFRIDLMEIESVVMDHPAVKEAVVVLKSNGSAADKSFILYVVSHRNQNLNARDLRKYLNEKLPQYMIPAQIVILDSLPVNRNGKIEKSKLPEPEIKNPYGNQEIHENPEVRRLLQVMKEVLNIADVSINNNYYELGGDSIKAIQISSRLKKYKLQIKVTDILENPIVKDMVIFLEKDSQKRPIDQNPCEGSIKATPIVSWFLSQKFVDPHYYNQSVLLHLKKDINKSDIQDVLNIILQHHDSFRINYTPNENCLIYNKDLLSKKLIITEIDISQTPTELQNHILENLSEQLKASIDIQNEFLLKACLFRHTNNNGFLLIISHHLAVDGVSWRIFLEDMSSLIQMKMNNQELILPMKTDSYQKWANDLEMYSKKINNDEIAFWNSIESFENNICKDKVKILAGVTDKMQNSLDSHRTGLLISKANEPYSTKPEELMIIALALSISDYFNTKQFIIELESHGRRDLIGEIDISRTIGWFTSIYPIAFKINDDNLNDLIKSLKEQIRKTPNNGISYGILKYIHKKLSKNNKNYIRFNYLGDFDNLFRNDLFQLSSIDTGKDSSLNNDLTCLLDINAMIINKELQIFMEYNNQHERINLNNFFEKYISNLCDLIKYCVNKDEKEFTPSDFDLINLSQKELDSLFC